MTGLLLLLGIVAIFAGLLLLTEVCDRALDEHRPGYARGWARVFGETEPARPLSHVRALSPTCTCPATCPSHYTPETTTRRPTKSGRS